MDFLCGLGGDSRYIRVHSGSLWEDIGFESRTPLIIINYTLLLENHEYFEDSFKVYERGTQLLKYAHAEDIWVTYLSKFVQRYGKTKLERARGIFEDAIKEAPTDAKKPLYLQFAKLDESTKAGY